MSYLALMQAGKTNPVYFNNRSGRKRLSFELSREILLAWSAGLLPQTQFFSRALKRWGMGGWPGDLTMSSPVLSWQEDRVSIERWLDVWGWERASNLGKKRGCLHSSQSSMCCVGSLTAFLSSFLWRKAGGRHCSQMHFFLLYIGGVNNAQDA